MNHVQKGSNYLLIFQKKSIFQVISKKGSIIQVKLKKSLSHCEKVLWFKFLSHIEQKGSILWAILKRRVQCLDSLLWKIFESHSKKSFLWVIFKIFDFFWVIFNEQNLWVVLKKSSIRGVLLFFFKKKVQFLKTY